MSDLPVQAAAPTAATLTDYDRRHVKTYLRMLDAVADGVDWREAAALLLGLDVAADPEKARATYDSHLARARWLSARGYRDFLR
ncbi:DNA -binding domain-containing protein [Phenylobacterium sp.]|uniref:DNA -binding domain-containing protein n=1 Tax=Phenylobacterium sp. TaxID=1871053 RepID=UPI0035B4EADE